METEHDFRSSPFTLPAASIEAGYVLLIFLSMCYLDDYKENRTTAGKRLIALFNFVSAIAYFVLATYLFGVHDSVDLLPGSVNDDQELLMKLFGISRLVQLLDTAILFYRGDKSRITAAHILHNSTVLVLWAIVLDNSTITEAGYRLIAAMHASILVCYHAYFVFATYGKCTYPCSYVLTTLLVSVHVSIAGVAAVMLYQANEDDHDDRFIVAMAWLSYSVIMVPVTLPFMWKKRLNKCWPTQRDTLPERTVGEVV